MDDRNRRKLYVSAHHDGAGPLVDDDLGRRVNAEHKVLHARDQDRLPTASAASATLTSTRLLSRAVATGLWNSLLTASAISVAVVKSGLRSSSETVLNPLRSTEVSRSTMRSLGNQADVGGVHFLAVGAVARGIAAHHQRPLRLGVDLAIRAVQRAHQQHAAFQAAGIADGRNGDVQPGARPRKRRQRRGNKDRRHILDHDCADGEISTPIFCMALASVCTVKLVCCVSPVPRRPTTRP